MAGAPPKRIPQSSPPFEPGIQPQVTSTARSLNGATIWSLFCHFNTWCQCFLGFRPKGPHLNPDTGDILGCAVGGRGGHSDAVYSLVPMGERALTSSSRALQEPKQNPSPSCGRPSTIQGASSAFFLLSQGQAQILPEEMFLSRACLKQGLTINYYYDFGDSRTCCAHKDTPSPRLDFCTEK